MSNEKTLYYLKELSDHKVAAEYCDVRGWEVVDGNGLTIGNVDGLLVNKEAERVVYLDVEVNKDLIEKGHETYAVPASQGAHEILDKDSENHLILPIGMVDLDEDGKKVVASEIDYAAFSKAARFAKGRAVSREHELTALRNYRPGAGVDYPSSIEEEFYNGREFENKLLRRDR